MLVGGADGDVLTWSGTAWGAAPVPDTSFTFTVTVAAGALVIAGSSMRLIEGMTYKFDQSDATNSTHQIAFSSAPDGIHAGGVEFASASFGTPGTPGAYTLLTVTSSTPSPLYYYCANHPNMGDSTTSLEKLAQLPSASGSGYVLTWDGSQWNGAPATGGGGASIPDGSQSGDIPIWIDGGSGGSWGVTSGPDPRYLAMQDQCRVLSFSSAVDGSTITETASMFTDVWLMCQNAQGEGVTLQIPDILDTDGPKGRRLLISDINGIAESDEIVVSIQAPSAGGTLGAIDSNVPGTTESVFDSASLTLVCTGVRTTPGDATTGLIWKIV